MRLRNFFGDLFSGALVFAGVSLILWLLVIPWYESTKAVYGKVWVVPESVPATPPLVVAERIDRKDLPFASLWREETGRKEESGRPVEFFLTIAKLGIDSARVKGGVDFYNGDPEVVSSLLATNLAHLKGSAYPGQWGNSVILGHSSLPFLFDEDNYRTIFSRLGDLSVGDFISLRFSDENFSYEVVEKRLVDSEKDFREDFAGPGRKLTLITCFPPGLTAKRLMIVARLLSKENFLSLR